MAITKIEVPELFDFGSDNSAFKLPTGTTAERPTSPSNGEMRFNTTTGYVEYYDTTDTQWWEIDYEALCTTNDPNYPITNLAYYKMSDASDSGEGSGYIGQGGIFNGSSSVISLGTSSPLNTFGGAQTISVWVKPSSASQEAIIGYRDDNSPYWWNLVEKMSNNTIRFLLGSTGNGQFVFNSVGTITLNQWNHIAITVDSTSAKIYINNGTAETLAGTPTSFSNSETTSIGGDGTTDTDYFTGSIDQVRIFPTALSSSNVSLLYAETSTTSSTLDYPVTATALYEFSGNANDTGNTYNGTATNVEYAYNGTATDVNFNVQGKFGNAGEFNGTSSYISTGINVSTTLMTSRSYSFWFKQNLNTNLSRIFGGANAGVTNNGMFRIREDNGTINYYSINNGVYTWTTTLTNDVWTHVALTDTGSLAKLYINGVEIASPSTSTYTTTTNTNLQIGRGRANSGSITNYANGAIDQIRIFDSALNASQVTQLYNEIQCVPTIVPSESFNTVLYTGNGGTKAITDVGFQPDFTWIKSRNAAGSHIATDSVRGNGKEIYPDLTNAQGTVNRISLTSTGFDVVSAGYPNQTSNTFVAWNWKAGGTAVSNTDGTNITSQVSANTAAGFSVVEWTGDANSSSTIGHGLTPNSQPMLVIMKDLDSSNDWMVITNNLWSNPTAYFLKLNLTNALATGTGNPYLVNNTVFQNTNRNVSGNDYIAYAFHSVDGFSKMGSYVGGGATNVTVNVGFAPSFIMIKSTSAGRNWLIYDNVRETGTVPYENDTVLFPDSSSAEVTGNTIRGIQFTSTGFVLNQNYGNTNGSGETHIFLAIAADPT